MKRPEIERMEAGLQRAMLKNGGNQLLKDFEAALIWIRILEEKLADPEKETR